MPISLFTTYFLHPSIKRQKELNFCLLNNISNKNISKIYLFIDGKTPFDSLNFIPNSKKLEIIQIERIPTYKDWIDNSQKLEDDGISVFTNADIYCNETLTQLNSYLSTNNSIVCLSRYEETSKGIEIHPDPKWSQDFWAISTKNIRSINFKNELNIPTGKCRCDNKLAYVFAMRGWNIYNPYRQIKCIHRHYSKLRDYKKTDKDLVGSLAFVNPTDSPDSPSSIEIEIMPLNSKPIIRIALNKFLEDN